MKLAIQSLTTSLFFVGGCAGLFVAPAPPQTSGANPLNAGQALTVEHAMTNFPAYSCESPRQPMRYTLEVNEKEICVVHEMGDLTQASVGEPAVHAIDMSVDADGKVSNLFKLEPSPSVRASLCHASGQEDYVEWTTKYRGCVANAGLVSVGTQKVTLKDGTSVYANFVFEGSKGASGVANSEGAAEAPKSEMSKAKSAANDVPLQKPASKLALGGVSLSAIEPKQVVAFFKKAGYRVEPSTATMSSFGDVAGHWETQSYELIKGKSAVGTIEIVRPAKKVRAVSPDVDEARSAKSNVTRFEKEATGLLTGGGVYEAESETSFSGFVTSSENWQAFTKKFVSRLP
jgi:hypothetical protein